jgi:general secretion pathway protein C
MRLKNAEHVATLSALALLGLVLAYWTWAWLAPPPAMRAPVIARTASGASPAAALLFRAVSGGPAAVNSTPGAMVLMGVVAASGERPGHAVLRLDAKRTVAVLQGAEVEPGTRLAEVHANFVVLERNGVRETLAWPERKGK